MAGYNDTLASNNVDLQSILDKVNALPEAGSGGTSVETCTIKLANGSGAYGTYYATTITDGNIDVSTGNIADESIANYVPDGVAAVEVICNSFMHLSVSDFRFASGIELSGGAELINRDTSTLYIKTPSEGGSICIIAAVGDEI